MKPEENGCSEKPVAPAEALPFTLRQHLDSTLEEARKQVLAICEAKAKAEFLGLLDAPYNDVRNLIYPSAPF